MQCRLWRRHPRLPVLLGEHQPSVRLQAVLTQRPFSSMVRLCACCRSTAAIVPRLEAASLVCRFGLSVQQRMCCCCRSASLLLQAALMQRCKPLLRAALLLLLLLALATIVSCWLPSLLQPRQYGNSAGERRCLASARSKTRWLQRKTRFEAALRPTVLQAVVQAVQEAVRQLPWRRCMQQKCLMMATAQHRPLLTLLMLLHLHRILWAVAHARCLQMLCQQACTCEQAELAATRLHLAVPLR